VLEDGIYQGKKLTEERILNLIGILATASLISVGLAIGEPIGTTVIAGIGINLSSAIIHQGETFCDANDI